MSRTFRLAFLSVFTLALSFMGCAKPPQHRATVQIRPVTAVESKWIRLQIERGAPILPQDLLPSTAGDQQKECEDLIGTISPRYKYGWVTVPENWDQPGGNSIRVFYYARPGSKPGTPVVFFNGGPASDSHSSLQAIDQVDEAKKHPFVFIDQRGTGCSSPFPTDPASTENVQRLANYGSRAIVKDAEAIRAQLFGRSSKWKIFGQSYGGYIVHRYLEVAPQSVDHALAHGSSIMSDPVAWVTWRVRSQHRVLENYLSIYPDDRAKLERLRSLVPADLCFESNSTRVCGAAVLDGLVIFLGFKSFWPALHQWIASLLPDTETVSQEAMEKFVRLYVFGVFANNALPSTVMTAMELTPGLTDHESCDQALSRLDAAGERPDTWLLNECRLTVGMQSPWDLVLGQTRAKDPISLEMISASLSMHPALRFFLYSGQADVFVPVETFSEEAQRLGGKMTYREFPDSGHEGFLTEPQVWSDLND